MKDVIFREEREADYDDIGKVVSAAFDQANEARLVTNIRMSPYYVPELSLVADEDGRIVGHVMFSYVQLERTEDIRNVLELAPVAVLPSRQGLGIGGKLIRLGLESADQRQEPLVTVLGDPPYYQRFGFRPAAHFDIQPPIGIPDEPFMAIALKHYDDRLRGRVTYPPAFDVT
jgi:putative acetyltransferase